MSRVAINTRAEHSIPWPAGEPPPRQGERILWAGELWEVFQILWVLSPALSCSVLVQPLCGLHDAPRNR